MDPLLTSRAGAVTVDQKLAFLLEEAAGQLKRGESVDLAKLAQDHPSHADAVRDLLPTVAAMIGMTRKTADENLDLSSSLGKYQLMAKLGEGGMGAVYMAMHTELQKVVAIKVLPNSRMNDSNAVARFRREMRAAGRFEHPNIVRASDAGEEGGRHFLVMEYIDGCDLSRLVRRIGPLPIADGAEIIKQTAQGLEFAHRNGMVHRDVKPSNIMITRQGQVKILDLGLALLDDRHHVEHADLTSTGQMIGTIDYMAPEQGSDSHAIDARVDVYSLGATLYQLLSGNAPFAGVRFDTLMKKMNALASVPAVPLDSIRPDVPKELAAVVARMLAKIPAERFGTTAEVAAAVEPFTYGSNLAGLLQVSSVSHLLPETDKSAISTSNQFRSEAIDSTVESGPVVRKPTTSPQTASRWRRWRWPLIAAAFLGPIVAAGLSLIIRDQSGKEKLRVALDKGDKIEVAEGQTIAVLSHVQPTIVGKGKDSVVGVPTPSDPKFENVRPRLPVRLASADAEKLQITKMFYCRENSFGAQRRPVKLWVPISDGPYAQVVSERAEDGIQYVTPTRDLQDGIYCLHSGPFSIKDSASAPAFCAPFVVRGYGEPETGPVSVHLHGTKATLSVKIKNKGSGAFDDGLLAITLQRRKSGERSQFIGRQNLRLKPIYVKGETESVSQWDMSVLKSGTYYFNGHVNYKYLYDANELCHVESEPFEWESLRPEPATAPATEPSISYVPVAPSLQYTVLAPPYSPESRDSLVQLLGDGGTPTKVRKIKSLAEIDQRIPGVLIIALDKKTFADIGPYHPQVLKQQKIVGIGHGAAKLFGELGLHINDGACAHGVVGPPRVNVQENSLVRRTGFESPMLVFDPPVLDPQGFHNELFFGMYVGENYSKPSDVDIVALQSADQNYAPIVRQGMQVMVCIDAPANSWSADFRHLIRATAAALDSQAIVKPSPEAAASATPSAATESNEPQNDDPEFGPMSR